jgi:hypothetical protein
MQQAMEVRWHVTSTENALKQLVGIRKTLVEAVCMSDPSAADMGVK